MKKNNLKTLIITCWAVLVLCFIIKIFGGNWFELGAENIKFIQFCNFVDNNMWLKMLLAIFISLFSNYFLICVLLNKQKLNIKEIILFGILIIIKSIASWYIVWLPFILDLFILILIPLIISKFKNWKRVLLCNILVMIFQLMSLITRNVGFLFIGNSFIEQTLIQIDYDIMLILYYLYNIKYFVRKEM